MVHYTSAALSALAVFVTSLIPETAAAADDLPYIFYGPPANNTENIYTASTFDIIESFQIVNNTFFIDVCTGACDKFDTCIGAAITIDDDATYCQTVSEGGIYSGFLPEVRLIAWRFDVPAGPVCSIDSGDWFYSINGQCSCGTNRENGTPFGCVTSAVAPVVPAPGPSQQSQKRSEIRASRRPIKAKKATVFELSRNGEKPTKLAPALSRA